MNLKSSSIQIVDPKIKNANKILHWSVRLLFSVAVIGQLIFVYYIVSYYGGSAIIGDFDKWNEALPNGFIKGETLRNISLVVHIALAAVITFGGPLQFIPQIRNRFPKFHRWNGRFYITIAFLTSFSGLYMIYTHAPLGGGIMTVGNTINAILIMYCLYPNLAYRHGQKFCTTQTMGASRLFGNKWRMVF